MRRSSRTINHTMFDKTARRYDTEHTGPHADDSGYTMREIVDIWSGKWLSRNERRICELLTNWIMFHTEQSNIWCRRNLINCRSKVQGAVLLWSHVSERSVSLGSTFPVNLITYMFSLLITLIILYPLNSSSFYIVATLYFIAFHRISSLYHLI